MKKTIAISIDESLVLKIRAEAKKEQRSVSQMVQILVTEALAQRAGKAAK